MRLRRGFVFVVPFLLALAPVSAAHADSGTQVTVTGRFLDSRGAPVARIEVQSSTDSTSTKSAVNGMFRLKVTDSTDDDGTPQPIDLYWGDYAIQEFGDGSKTVTGTGTTFNAGTIRLARLTPYPTLSKHAVPTSRKAAVSAWDSKFRALLKIGGRGSAVHGCHIASQPTQALQSHTLAAINLMRELVGENPVKLMLSYTKQAQQAALISYWNGLDHMPPKSAKCWTRAGAGGAASSDLSSGDAGAAVVLDYMSDNLNLSGPDAGHRSWLIDPTSRYMGVGQTTGAGAIYVIDRHASDTNPTPQWIRWPTAGYFPRQVQPGGLWSFMTDQAGYDLSHASVAVTFDHAKLSLKRYYVTGYGDQSGLVWQVHLPTSKGLARLGSYRVTVSGIKYRGTIQPRYSYQVTLF